MGFSSNNWFTYFGSQDLAVNNHASSPDWRNWNKTVRTGALKNVKIKTGFSYGETFPTQNLIFLPGLEKGLNGPYSSGRCLSWASARDAEDVQDICKDTEYNRGASKVKESTEKTLTPVLDARKAYYLAYQTWRDLIIELGNELGAPKCTTSVQSYVNCQKCTSVSDRAANNCSGPSDASWNTSAPFLVDSATYPLDKRTRDVDIVPYYAEYYFAPAIEKIMAMKNTNGWGTFKTSVTNVSNAISQASLDMIAALLEYQIVGGDATKGYTVGTNVRGKKIKALVDAVACHYLFGRLSVSKTSTCALQYSSLDWLSAANTLWNYIGAPNSTVSQLLVTEECGTRSRKNGEVGLLAVRCIARALHFARLKNADPSAFKLIFYALDAPLKGPNGDNNGTVGDVMQILYDLWGSSPVEELTNGSSPNFGITNTGAPNTMESYTFRSTTNNGKIATFLFNGDGSGKSPTRVSSETAYRNFLLGNQIRIPCGIENTVSNVTVHLLEVGDQKDDGKSNYANRRTAAFTTSFSTGTPNTLKIQIDSATDLSSNPAVLITANLTH